MSFTPIELESPKADRSRLQLLALLASIGSLGWSSVQMMLFALLSNQESTKKVILTVVEEFIQALEAVVSAPPLIETGEFVLNTTATEESQEVYPLFRPVKDEQLDIQKIVLSGRLLTPRGKYTYAQKNTSAFHTLLLGLHGRLKRVESGEKQLVEIDPFVLEYSNGLALVAMDSLPNIIQPSEVRFLQSGKNTVSLDALIPEHLGLLEKMKLSVEVTGLIKGLPEQMMFLASDIHLPAIEHVPHVDLLIEDNAIALNSIQRDFGFLATVYAARAVISGVGIIVEATAEPKKEQVSTGNPIDRRTFMKWATRVAVGGAIVATTATGGSVGIDTADILEQVKALAWAYNFPFQVESRTPKDYIGRVLAFLQKTEHEIPKLAYFLFIRELISTYKEMVIIQSGLYSNEGTSDSLSVWGFGHDTKVGLLALSQKQLLSYIRQAIESFPKLFAECFGEDAVMSNALEKLTYLGPHELYTACAYHAEAYGDNQWKVIGAEVWVFDELKEIVGSA